MCGNASERVRCGAGSIVLQIVGYRPGRACLSLSSFEYAAQFEPSRGG